MIASLTKPKVSAANELVLTSHQTDAYTGIKNFLVSSERFFLLTGYAGTGKSTTLTQAAKEYLAANPYARIALCAMSNKAVKVLKNMAEEIEVGDRAAAVTICSLLGLRPKINNQTGQQEFLPDKKTPSTLHEYDVVVFDECSQIGRTMWELITDAVMAAGVFATTKIIFTGDPAQLPPIGEEGSPTFHLVPESNRAHLSKVVRYDGAVAHLAERVRTMPNWHERPVIGTEFNEDKTKGVWAVDADTFGLIAEKLFGGAEYANDPDYGRIICYRNATVNDWNSRIYHRLYGLDAPRFTVGMSVMANSPVFKGGTGREIIMNNSDEGRVTEIHQGLDGSWPIWVVRIQLPDKWDTIVCHVLHESAQPKFDEQLQVMAASKNWRKFWDLKNRFADLRYCYALTSHKAQGSTFRNVFVALPDILNARNKKEVDQLIYVALTRASHRVFVHGASAPALGVMPPPSA